MQTKSIKHSVKPLYLLISVEDLDPLPSWLLSGQWCRYIIRQGSSDIVGYMPGAVSLVREYAESVAIDLNERASNGTYTTHRNKSKLINYQAKPKS